MTPEKIIDSEVVQVLDALKGEYGVQHPKAKIESYRYNRYCIRVRIIDPELSKVHLVDRAKMFWEMVRKTLPESIRKQILHFSMHTPTEARTSGMSVEFDDPLPDEELPRPSARPSKQSRRRDKGKN